MHRWRPFDALVVGGFFVAELLAEGEVGAYAAAARVVEVTARGGTITGVFAIVALGTDGGYFVGVGVVAGL